MPRAWNRGNSGIAAVLFAAVLALSGCRDDKEEPVPPQPSPQDILRVGDAVFTREDLNNILPGPEGAALGEEDKKTFVKRWVEVELLYQEALRRGLQKDPLIDWRIKNLQKQFLADHLLYLEMRERINVTEEEIGRYFEDHRREYEREYRVRHILVNTLEEAEKVKELLKSNSFTYIANRYSVDPEARRGGDLGYLAKGNMIPEFEPVVFSLRDGQNSDIVKSEFGYHIIRLVGSRKILAPAHIEDVREEIINELIMEKRQKAHDEFISSLEREIGVEYYNEAYRRADSAGTGDEAPNR